jgi:hypothetical protein
VRSAIHVGGGRSPFSFGSMARLVTTKTKWAIALTLTAALAITLWLAAPSRHSEGFTLGFAGFTNYQSDRVAVFDLTNHHNVPVEFLVAVERKSASGWPVYAPGTTLPHSAPRRVEQDPKLMPGETYRLLVIVPAGEDFTAWRVSVGYIPIPSPGPFDRQLQDARTLADDAGLPRLAAVLAPGRRCILVLGPEMSK